MTPGLGGYTSIGGAVKKMFREEGFRAFYKGLYPNLLKVRSPCNYLIKVAPSMAASWVTFEFVRDMLLEI
jgi:solute carrier family 25 (mitochondrial phosphate transporter), member 23/24/25/41